jgi:hypothetical protein
MSVSTFKTAILLYLLDFSGLLDKKLKISGLTVLAFQISKNKAFVTER